LKSLPRGAPDLLGTRHGGSFPPPPLEGVPCTTLGALRILAPWFFPEHPAMAARGPTKGLWGRP
jgi:hypothetical protein